MIYSSWNTSASGLKGARRVAFKLRRLKRALKQWSRTVYAARSAKKQELQKIIQDLDRSEEENDQGLEEESDQEAGKGSRTNYGRNQGTFETYWQSTLKKLFASIGAGNQGAITCGDYIYGGDYMRRTAGAAAT
ncbi:hypothetical protein QJS10_CPA16g00527 [Acorus calamus]|uniref:Uncharacterized protein n=1 Tax=Acorus calamus TaxID=4465 RepID=A0AAV9D032_ACOCL|nr:hypothetical protein QJS10_CPA16g00527 [Acorus calamus]